MQSIGLKEARRDRPGRPHRGGRAGVYEALKVGGLARRRSSPDGPEKQGGGKMQSFFAQELVRQRLDEVNRKAEELGRHRPPRRHHEVRVFRWLRHDGE